MRVIVVTLDRLPARLLACYGNEWVETPGFDQLAARSTVCDQHFAELPGPAGPSHPWWTGQLEFFTSGDDASSAGAEGATVSALVEAGVNCRLLTERIEGLPLDAFSSWERVEAATGLDVDHSETPIARLVQRALEVAGEFDGQADESSNELLWLHSAGVPSPWLPPRFFAELYLNELEEEEVEEEWDENTGKTLIPEFDPEASEEDPEPEVEFDSSGILDDLATNPAMVESLLSDAGSSDEPEADVSTPQGELERLISRYIFAGYVSLIDHWIGRLAKGLDEVAAKSASGGSTPPETVLIVTAASGHASGGRPSFIEVRDGETELCDELLQTPLLIHRIGESEFGTRCRTLLGPQDLAPTLCEFFGVAQCGPGLSLKDPQDTGLSSRRHQLLHLSPCGEVAIRDEEWLLVLPDRSLLNRESLEESDDLLLEAKLYALPDDLWQVNDVSSLRSDVVFRLAAKLQTELRAAGRLPAHN
jgi:arylsulfatase A-like enzyme